MILLDKSLGTDYCREIVLLFVQFILYALSCKRLVNRGYYMGNINITHTVEIVMNKEAGMIKPPSIAIKWEKIFRGSSDRNHDMQYLHIIYTAGRNALIERLYIQMYTYIHLYLYK